MPDETANEICLWLLPVKTFLKPNMVANPATPSPSEPLADPAVMLRVLGNGLPALIAFYDARTLRCLFANARYAQLNGHDEQSVLGKTVEEIIGTPAWLQIAPHVERVYTTLQGVRYERTAKGPHGERIIDVSLVPVGGPDQALFACAVLISDITDRRAAEQALKESEERLAKFFAATEEGICFHESGLFTDANEAALRLISATTAEVIGQPVLTYVAPEYRDMVRAHIESGYEKPYEAAIVNRHGVSIPVEFHGRTFTARGETHRMTVVRDIRDRKEAERRIQYLAHHDMLTGLPNRTQLIERFTYAITSAERHQAELAVAFFDLDNFKEINDGMGHAAGDTVLQNVAQRLKTGLRASDIVARLGGDEFVAIISDLTTTAALHELLDRLVAAIAAPIPHVGGYLQCTMSVGVAAFPRDGQLPDALIKAADDAMYRAKAGGKNRWSE
jgi:diguanylate cyclase (GGDEF)-like protein/PAS domain S-box-containing protein